MINKKVKLSLLLVCITTICIIVIASNINKIKNVNTTKSYIDLLDSNQDGKINPYEALDALLVVSNEGKEELSIDYLAKISKENREQEQKKIMEEFSYLDTNGDKILDADECKEIDFYEIVDSNQDEKITLEEFKNFNIEKVLFKSPEEVEMEVKEIFANHLEGKIKLSQIDEQYWDIDLNKDKIITMKECKDFLTAESSSAKFIIDGKKAKMLGTINNTTPTRVLELIFKYPQVKTIEMLIVPGSIDDVSNIRAAKYIRKFGFTTVLNSNSYVSSGGTDFFLAGKRRIVKKGATIGVHSWGGGNTPAVELPKDDIEHKKYLNYYDEIGIPSSFYWYTLKSAPANGMHFMTEKEIKKYKIRTK